MEINIEDPLSDKLKTILQQNGDSEFDYTPIVNDILNYTMEECTFAISTLLIESKRRQWSTIDLKEYLEKFLSNPHQIKILAKKYEDEMQTLEETLDEIRIPKTRLVEFQWRLQHEVYNSFQGRVSKPKCLIQLQFLKPDTNTSTTSASNPTITRLFCCQEDELQDLLIQLKDICNNIRRHTFVS